jgi:superfamily II DNA or RNA helicase
MDVVTGAGKTILAEMCILSLKKEHPDLVVIVVVPTLALIDQWYVSLTHELNVSQADIAIYSGEGKPSEVGAINLLTINTAREWVSRIASVSPKTFLIADECHRYASPMNAKALASEHFATLGLSATPERDYDEGLTDVLIPALGEVIVEYDYNQARADGVIAPFDLINVQVPLTDEETRKYSELTARAQRLLKARSKGEDVEDRLKVVFQRRANVGTRARYRIPVATRLVEQHAKDKVLVFHEQIASADTIAENLRVRGNRPGVYHSKIDPAIRRDNLRLYRHGVFNILITCRALDEGINVPETTVAIIAGSTASTRQRIQRLGRVLRPAEGKERATIYTLYATSAEEERLLAESEELIGAESVSWMKASG